MFKYFFQSKTVPKVVPVNTIIQQASEELTSPNDTIIGSTNSTDPILVMNDSSSNLKNSASRLDLFRKSLQDVSKLFTKPVKENVTSQNLKISIVTWNMGGKIPDINIAPILKPGLQEDPHLIVVGTQECQNSIEKSLLITSKDEWENILKFDIGSDYILMSSETLTGIHIAVFVKRNISSQILGISTGRIATGIGNIIGNKGGIAVAVKINDFDIVFVNSHLPAHDSKVQERNSAYNRINLDMPLFGFKSGSIKKKGIVERYDYVFWLGDLNYRVNTSRVIADKLIQQGNVQELLKFDQLNNERLHGRAFKGFIESPISFYPTFKYDTVSNLVGSKKLELFLSRKQTREDLSVSRTFSISSRQSQPLTFSAIGGVYTPPFDSSSKLRIQSWTDRILYKTRDLPSTKSLLTVHEDMCMVECIFYQSLMEIHCSDHKPVIGLYKLSNCVTFGGEDEIIGAGKQRRKRFCCCC